jgi:hypothetical protein
VLRSSLDNLAWLAAKTGKANPSRATAFPILSPDANWESDKVQAMVKDIPVAFLDIIKDVQPYRRSESFRTHPLWMLKELDNVDKHELPPIFGLVHVNSGLVIEGLQGSWSVYDQTLARDIRAKQGAEIARFRVDSDVDPDRLSVKFEAADDVEFGDTRLSLKGQRVFPTLRQMRDYIDSQVLRRFSDAYPRRE